MSSREYSSSVGVQTIVDAPHAGHTAMIADYHKGQSLIETLLENGVRHIALTDWNSATEDMKDLDIGNYLAELLVAIDDLGGRVNLVGLCQGFRLSAMLAARFPEKVNTLVLAGSPIDTQAGDGPLKRMLKSSPASFYEELLGLCDGPMKGKFMLQGWKNMHPLQHYVEDHVDLYEHINDPDYVSKRETFESWHENPIDLPGRWHLQAISQLFRENRFCKGEFIGRGRKLNLADIKCRPTCWQALRTTSRRLNRCSMRPGTSARPRTASCLAVISGCSFGARTLKEDRLLVAKWIVAQ